jgi:hypothetical protein
MDPTPTLSNPTLKRTAVLFLIFNRPDTTAKVFEVIRQVRPPRLYVAADGARDAREDDVEKVSKSREIATAIDWPCELKMLFRDKNLGCKHAVSGAITWLFEHEEQGIILEDDCLPHPDFFIFCETLLDRYAENESVSVITGNNFQNGRLRGDFSYYFSKYNHCWGWASWRRAWKHYQGDLPFWPEWSRSEAWLKHTADNVESKYWKRIFDRVWLGELNSWAYPWTASVWYHGGLTATPNVNLVSNIGFGPDSTHTTTSSHDSLAGMPTTAIGELAHPSTITQDQSADHYVFEYTFGGRGQRLPWALLELPRRVVAYIHRKLMRSST